MVAVLFSEGAEAAAKPSAQRGTFPPRCPGDPRCQVQECQYPRCPRCPFESVKVKTCGPRESLLGICECSCRGCCCVSRY